MQMYIYLKKGPMDPRQKLIRANRPRAKVNQCKNKLGQTKFRANGPGFLPSMLAHLSFIDPEKKMIIND